MTNNMKKTYCLLYMLGLLAFTSCVDDGLFRFLKYFHYFYDSRKKQALL